MGSMKYSRQRASIKEYLMSTVDHPTADTVYLHVRKEFPRISLGTVYRNLNLLADMGEAVKITTPNGGDRFDGRTDPHYHVVCTSCGKVFDLKLTDTHMDEINKIANEHFDGKIDSHTTLFYGTCRDCMENKKEKKIQIND
ncbi:MAG: transcriptional repressor [Lachnospiraceae bacterium]|nr:transcriptional repressor [Massilistercora timonensis]